ncbi:hypothetical protein Xen7305DRAFT_00018340, partial [Xenococcus sp. PCC 7305]|uniref:Ig-like domain-containing protein n=1 Tax=Xenococcus sp. PCC 7305 TaxID=102125 RepID=UPI0002ABF228
EEDFNGIDTYSYTIADGNGGTATANVEITVESINDDPIAVDDEDTTDEDTAVTTAVLDNDSDPDEDSLTVTSATDGGNGTTTVNADGTITYTPEEDFNGTDTYSYTIDDGNGGTATANVEITVGSVNDDPIANDDADTTDENTPATTAVLDNDSDPDEDSLTVTSATDGANGTTVVNADNSITYTPEEDFSGTDTYSYTIADGNGGTATANVEITVESINDDPIANDDADTTDENTPATTAVLDNDSDPDEDSLTVTSATDGANGTTAVNADGSITYTPEEDFSGIDTYSYTIDDGNGGTDTAIVTITVENLPPDAVDNSYETSGATPVSGNLITDDTGEISPITGLGVDSDPEDDTLNVLEFTDPGAGTVVVEDDGSFTYTPNEGFAGVDSFTYTIDDGNGGT